MSTKITVGDVVLQRVRGEVTVPEVVHSYNHSMNGCDKVDQMIAYYGHYTRKSCKWWKRLYYWSLEISQVNAFILYKLKKELPNLTLKSYKRALITQILSKVADLGEPCASRRSTGRPTATPVERLESNKHLVDWVPNDRNCVVCSKPGARKRTNFICIGCSDKPYLHPKNCFKVYHTKSDYK